MFAFKLWGNFGVFRDPITITQNMTLSIPPKTTIGGMLAAILGIDYNNYFKDHTYFNFEYSLVLINPIRKKSFSQNYVEDYTKKSESKYNSIDYLINNEPKKIEKKLLKCYEDLSKKMTKPKPIYRELLINPSYLIFINDYKYENEIIPFMKNHNTSFALYMGNSEFSANYEYLECMESKSCMLNNVNSFTKSLDEINFDIGKYTTIYTATKVIGLREYRDYKRIVICDKPISFKKKIQGYSIKLITGIYNCEFI